MSGEIVIDEYDPRWPREFEKLRDGVATALGPIAAAIEHVGSTAVPGLAAKPIIDLDVLLKTRADLARVISALQSIGYEPRGDLGIPGREAFRAPAGSFPHHLYVCFPDAEEYWRHLAFRDHLRSHREAAEAYASLKRRLANEFPGDREAYTQQKSEFVEQILRRARREHSGRGERILS
jgi:GrpB-like predicted nucleotidyltransferase (UPF0157 family)